MTIPASCWFELTLALPLAGALAVTFIQPATLAARWALGFLLATLASALLVTGCFDGVRLAGPPGFAVDALAAPLLPAFALLHLITLLGTAKSRISSPFCTRLLLAAFVHAAALTCNHAGGLVALLLLGAILPLWDLWDRARPVRGYVLHMLLFAGLLFVGWRALNGGDPTRGRGWLLAALLLRGGIVPLHGWVPRLFQGAAFGTAMVFVLPVVEGIVAVRLLLPVTPVWMLDWAAVACLVTAVYGGAMAVVQDEVRKFYAHLCLSQTSLLLFALMLHTANSLTAALCLWISMPLALAGLAFAVRALEARFGVLSLREHHGHYEQVPGLAICFLVTGLASVGFPGTIGFVPMELLISGSVEHGLGISFTLAVAAMLNGIAILRAYFALFTGKRPTTSVSLQVTALERAGIVLITVTVFLGGWFSPGLVASRHDTAEKLLERKVGGHPGPPLR